MLKIFIIVNAEVKVTGELILASPATETMVASLRKAIAHSTSQPIKVEIIANSSLWSQTLTDPGNNSNLIYCPLTITLPGSFNFPASDLYQACQQIEARRTWVAKNLGYRVGINDSWFGNLWLPIILTAKGPIYGEVIGEGVLPNSFEQPIDLPDQQRQALYNLAYKLLESLSAQPSVYLLQFGWQEQQIIFDRLWPFPAAPSIASLRVQQPDLFTCYWYCLTNRPLGDILILGR